MRSCSIDVTQHLTPFEVTRIVAAWYQVGQNTWPRPPPDGEGGPNFSSWTDDEVGKLHHFSGENSTGIVNKFVDVQGTGDEFHGRLAKEIATEAIVLLKNEGDILPLNRKGFSDNRSSGKKFQLGIFGEDAGPGQGPNFCKDRGCNQGTLASGWGSGKFKWWHAKEMCHSFNAGAVEFPYLVSPFQALEAEFDHDNVNVTSHLSNNIPDLDSIAKQDLCLAFVNSDSGEGHIKWSNIAGDRPNLNIQKGGDNLIKSLNPKCGDSQGAIVVVVHSVGPAVLEEWIDLPSVKAVIWAGLPGVREISYWWWSIY